MALGKSRQVSALMSRNLSSHSPNINILLNNEIERKNKEGNNRISLYTVTLDALLHLGLKNMSELPEYDNIKKQLEVASQEALEEN